MSWGLTVNADEFENRHLIIVLKCYFDIIDCNYSISGAKALEIFVYKKGF